MGLARSAGGREACQRGRSVGFDHKSQNQSHIPLRPHLALPGQTQGKESMASRHNRKAPGRQSPAGHNRPEKLQSFSWNQSQCQTDQLEHRQGEDGRQQSCLTFSTLQHTSTLVILARTLRTRVSLCRRLLTWQPPGPLESRAFRSHVWYPSGPLALGSSVLQGTHMVIHGPKLFWIKLCIEKPSRHNLACKGHRSPPALSTPFSLFWLWVWHVWVSVYMYVRVWKCMCVTVYDCMWVSVCECVSVQVSVQGGRALNRIPTY